MFIRIWQYRPKSGLELEFTHVYGPDGAWAKLFAEGSGYVSTELRPAEHPRHEFQTIDRWESRAAWEAFRKSHAAEYERLDRETAALTERETLVSEYDEP